MSEAGKVAIITGASRGIGRSLALKFAEEGMQLVLTARNPVGLKETRQLIMEKGGKEPLLISADLRDVKRVHRIAGAALEEYGRVDVLVNNAGILYLKPFLELTREEFEEMMDVNMKAVFLLTQAVLPDMIARKSGAIVNIASLAGKNGFKNGTGYGASKFALRGFAMSLLQEVREHNIRVITIFPGSVNTDMAGSFTNGPKRDTLIQPEDVAEITFAALSLPERTMVSEIDLRPTNPRRA